MQARRLHQGILVNRQQQQKTQFAHSKISHGDLNHQIHACAFLETNTKTKRYFQTQLA